MKTNLLFLITIIIVLSSNQALADVDRKLVINPGIPDSSEQITFSVTDSGCYQNSQVTGPTAEDPSIHITLTFLAEQYAQCLEDNPNPPDFEITFEPLSPGEYRAVYFERIGSHGSNVTDERVFTVIDTPNTADLSEGGINGLFYQPYADGRYVYVLETDYTTMVMWTTFDEDGNQLWVYGLGKLRNNGSTLIATAFINQNIGFLPNGEAEIEDMPWGTIRVDLTSCLQGMITYQSVLPEYGSGQFEIGRLAYSKQIGCVEME